MENYALQAVSDDAQEGDQAPNCVRIQGFSVKRVEVLALRPMGPFYVQGRASGFGV